MAHRRSAEQAALDTGGPGVTVDSPVLVGQTATLNLASGPPDVDVVFSVALPGGGASEQTVHTDDVGAASIDVVPGATGPLSVAVSQTTVAAIASLEADVSGSAAAVPLTLTAIDPTTSPSGPPDGFVLLVTGTGFDINTRASFGVFSQAESDAGLGVAGDPKWEATTRWVDANTVSLNIDAGQFPSPDPAIPVSVGQPDGTTAGPINFAFT